ncbi:mucin-17 [Rhinichthys klamathensis goyatoka]|uniref:mucin-17 n=1 Tax=Rhinichthys klamathensis goyatoka TaxID=3034132 RepID=UPI0024B4C67B|nr:mucin-17 [Rhinichthys klamathensis goyatoka]
MAESPQERSPGVLSRIGSWLAWGWSGPALSGDDPDSETQREEASDEDNRGTAGAHERNSPAVDEPAPAEKSPSPSRNAQHARTQVCREQRRRSENDKTVVKRSKRSHSFESNRSRSTPDFSDQDNTEQMGRRRSGRRRRGSHGDVGGAQTKSPTNPQPDSPVATSLATSPQSACADSAFEAENDVQECSGAEAPNSGSREDFVRAECVETHLSEDKTDSPSSPVTEADIMDEEPVVRMTESAESKRRSIKVSHSEKIFAKKLLVSNEDPQGTFKSTTDPKWPRSDEKARCPEDRVDGTNVKSSHQKGRIADKISLFERGATKAVSSSTNLRHLDISPARNVAIRLKEDAGTRSSSAPPKQTVKERAMNFSAGQRGEEKLTLSSGVSGHALSEGLLKTANRTEASCSGSFEKSTANTSGEPKPIDQTDSKSHNATQSKPESTSDSNIGNKELGKASCSAPTVSSPIDESPPVKSPNRTGSRSKKRRSKEPLSPTSKNKQEMGQGKQEVKDKKSDTACNITPKPLIDAGDVVKTTDQYVKSTSGDEPKIPSKLEKAGDIMQSMKATSNTDSKTLQKSPHMDTEGLKEMKSMDKKERESRNDFEAQIVTAYKVSVSQTENSSNEVNIERTGIDSKTEEQQKNSNKKQPVQESSEGEGRKNRDPIVNTLFRESGKLDPSVTNEEKPPSPEDSKDFLVPANSSNASSRKDAKRNRESETDMLVLPEKDSTTCVQKAKNDPKSDEAQRPSKPNHKSKEKDCLTEVNNQSTEATEQLKTTETHKHSNEVNTSKPTEQNIEGEITTKTTKQGKSKDSLAVKPKEIKQEDTTIMATSQGKEMQNTEKNSSTELKDQTKEKDASTSRALATPNPALVKKLNDEADTIISPHIPPIERGGPKRDRQQSQSESRKASSKRDLQQQQQQQKTSTEAKDGDTNKTKSKITSTEITSIVNGDINSAETEDQLSDNTFPVIPTNNENLSLRSVKKKPTSSSSTANEASIEQSGQAGEKVISKPASTNETVSSLPASSDDKSTSLVLPKEDSANEKTPQASTNETTSTLPALTNEKTMPPPASTLETTSASLGSSDKPPPASTNDRNTTPSELASTTNENTTSPQASTNKTTSTLPASTNEKTMPPLASTLETTSASLGSSDDMIKPPPASTNGKNKTPSDSINEITTPSASTNEIISSLPASTDVKTTPPSDSINEKTTPPRATLPTASTEIISSLPASTNEIISSLPASTDVKATPPSDSINEKTTPPRATLPTASTEIISSLPASTNEIISSLPASTDVKATPPSDSINEKTTPPRATLPTASTEIISSLPASTNEIISSLPASTDVKATPPSDSANKSTTNENITSPQASTNKTSSTLPASTNKNNTTPSDSVNEKTTPPRATLPPASTNEIVSSLPASTNVKITPPSDSAKRKTNGEKTMHPLASTNEKAKSPPAPTNETISTLLAKTIENTTPPTASAKEKTTPLPESTFEITSTFLGSTNEKTTPSPSSTVKSTSTLLGSGDYKTTPPLVLTNEAPKTPPDSTNKETTPPPASTNETASTLPASTNTNSSTKEKAPPPATTDSPVSNDKTTKNEKTSLPPASPSFPLLSTNGGNITPLPSSKEKKTPSDSANENTTSPQASTNKTTSTLPSSTNEKNTASPSSFKEKTLPPDASTKEKISVSEKSPSPSSKSIDPATRKKEFIPKPFLLQKIPSAPGSSSLNRDSPSSWLDLDLQRPIKKKQLISEPKPKLGTSVRKTNLDTSGEIDPDDFIVNVKRLAKPFNLPQRKHNHHRPKAPPFVLPAIREDLFEKPFDPEEFQYGLRRRREFILDLAPSSVSKSQDTDAKKEDSKPKSTKPERESILTRSLIFQRNRKESEKEEGEKEEGSDESKTEPVKTEPVKTRSRLERCSIVSLLRSPSKGRRMEFLSPTESPSDGLLSPSDALGPTPTPQSQLAPTAESPEQVMIEKVLAKNDGRSTPSGSQVILKPSKDVVPAMIPDLKTTSRDQTVTAVIDTNVPSSDTKTGSQVVLKPTNEDGLMQAPDLKTTSLDPQVIKLTDTNSPAPPGCTQSGSQVVLKHTKNDGPIKTPDLKTALKDPTVTMLTESNAPLSDTQTGSQVVLKPTKEDGPMQTPDLKTTSLNPQVTMITDTNYPPKPRFTQSDGPSMTPDLKTTSRDPTVTILTDSNALLHPSGKQTTSQVVLKPTKDDGPTLTPDQVTMLTDTKTPPLLSTIQIGSDVVLQPDGPTLMPDLKTDASAPPPFPSFEDIKMPSFLDKFLPKEPETTRSSNTVARERASIPGLVDLNTAVGVADGKTQDVTIPPPPQVPEAQIPQAKPQRELPNIPAARGIHRRPAKIVIFEHHQFNGQSFEFFREQPDATQMQLSGVISVKVVRGCWILYEKPGFEGRCIALEEEIVNELPNQWAEEGEETPAPMVIGSIRLAIRDYTPPRIELFTEPTGMGRSFEYVDITEEVGSFSLPQNTGSIKVHSGLWMVYSDPGFQGLLAVMEAGEYPYPEDWGFPSPIVGSLRPLRMGLPKVENPTAVKAVLYEEAGLEGRCVEVQGDVFSFSDPDDHGLNCVESLKILGGLWVGYEHEGFDGHQFILEEGEYLDWRDWGGTGQKLLSLRPVFMDFSSPHVKMFSEPDFSELGVSIDLLEPLEDASDTHYGPHTRSIEVLAGVWVAFEDAGLCGRQYVLEKGLYGSPEDWGAADSRISCVIPVTLGSLENSCHFQLELFPEPGLGGTSVVLQDSLPRMPEGFIVRSCRVCAGSWLAFGCEGFSGHQCVLEEGVYPDLRTMGFTQPDASVLSVQPTGHEFSLPSIVLFERPGLRGRRTLLKSSSVNLQLTESWSRVSSVLVEGGMWVLYEASNFRGSQFLLKPGAVPDWPKLSSWRRIGSLRPIMQKQPLFRLRNEEAGLMMSVTGSLDDIKLMRIQGTEERGGADQIWAYQDGRLQCKWLLDCCVDVGSGVLMPGARAVLSSEFGKPHQIWNITSDGIIRSNSAPNLVLEVKGGQQFDKTQIILNEFNPKKMNQRWSLEIL